MSPEALIYLLILVIVVLGMAYAITYALGQANMPPFVIYGVWLVAALILLMILLRQTNVVHIGLLLEHPMGVIESLIGIAIAAAGIIAVLFGWRTSTRRDAAEDAKHEHELASAKDAAAKAESRARIESEMAHGSDDLVARELRRTLRDAQLRRHAPDPGDRSGG